MTHSPSFKIGIYQATLKIMAYIPIEMYDWPPVHTLSLGNYSKIFTWASGTPSDNTSEVRQWQGYHWKIGFKGFPTVYDMPISLNIGLSYTVGKPLNSAFQWSGPHIEVRKRVTAYLLPASLPGLVDL